MIKFGMLRIINMSEIMSSKKYLMIAGLLLGIVFIWYGREVGAVRILCYALYHSFVILVPILFFIEKANYWGLKNELIILSFAAVASGVLSYLIFWFYLFDTRLGAIFGVLFTLFAAHEVMKKGNACVRVKYLRDFNYVVLIWMLYSVFILASGLSPFGVENALANVAQRFSHSLPIDNQLPLIFAKQIAVGNVAKPMIGDWLSSDRPPLQTGYFLASNAIFLPDKDIHYQVNASLLQNLWVIGLWYVLRSRVIDRSAIVLATAVTIFCGFSIVNSLFTWPKLLPAFFLILLFGILFDSDTSRSDQPLVPIISGFLAALAMLCHGGSVFSIIGIGLALMACKKTPNTRFVIFSFLVGVMLLITWSFYQTYMDPPGNRLLKWHLAGVIPVDQRSFGKALLESYSSINTSEFFQLKMSNVRALLGDFKDWGLFIKVTFFGGEITQRVAVRQVQFFTLFASCGYLIVGVFLAFINRKAKRKNERNLAVEFLVTAFFTICAWVLLLFGPAYTVIHQGSLVLLIFISVGSTLMVYSHSKYMSWIISMLHFLSVFSIYFSYGWSVEGFVPDYSLYILSFTAFVGLIATMHVLNKERIQ